MKKSVSAMIAALLIAGCIYPAFAAEKTTFTDKDSGFSIQSTEPSFEYASRNSYGFQESRSSTNTINSVAAIPADVVEKITGQPFTTKEFMKQLAAGKENMTSGKPEYLLFQPETYVIRNKKASENEGLFQVFEKEELENAAVSCSKKTVGTRSYYVISMQYPGSFDKEKKIESNASDIQLNITSENDILYLVESCCRAETEEAADSSKQSADKKGVGKDESKVLLSKETAESAMEDPRSLANSLVPLSDSPLNNAKLQKNLRKERESLLKNLVIFKPSMTKTGFGATDPLLNQFVALPDSWMYLKAKPVTKKDEVKLNVTLAAPYSMVTDIAAMSSSPDSEKDWRNEDMYNVFSEGLMLVSIKIPQKGKQAPGKELEELFNIPQEEMQKVLDKLLPELTKNEKVNQHAVFSNPIAKITNDGKMIRLNFDTNVKFKGKYEIKAQSMAAATTETALLSLYLAKGDKTITESAANAAQTLNLLPQEK